jgi:hypothetical protein
MIRISRLLGIVPCVLVGLSLAGCQSDNSSTTPHSAGTGSTASTNPANVSPSTDGSTSWHPTLTVKSDTLYLGRGQLPVPEVDRTTATGDGDLLLKVQCDKGHFNPQFTIDGNDQRIQLTCTGEVTQQTIAPVRKGSTIAIQPQGDAGTYFVLELTITKTPAQP